MSKVCRSCGAILIEEAKFCDKCGLKLTNNCSNCGALFNDADKFCQYCGHATNSTMSEPAISEAAKTKKINNIQWYFMVLKKYAQFKGRSRRKEYWMFMLFNLVISFALGFLGGFIEAYFNIGTDMDLGLLASLYILLTLVPSLAVSIRRLHDTNHSGWWLLIAIIPFAGLWILWLLCKDSDHTENRYGPIPYQYGLYRNSILRFTL